MPYSIYNRYRIKKILPLGIFALTLAGCGMEAPSWSPWRKKNEQQQMQMIMSDRRAPEGNTAAASPAPYPAGVGMGTGMAASGVYSATAAPVTGVNVMPPSAPMPMAALPPAVPMVMNAPAPAAAAQGMSIDPPPPGAKMAAQAQAQQMQQAAAAAYVPAQTSESAVPTLSAYAPSAPAPVSAPLPQASPQPVQLSAPPPQLPQQSRSVGSSIDPPGMAPGSPVQIIQAAPKPASQAPTVINKMSLDMQMPGDVAPSAGIRTATRQPVLNGRGKSGTVKLIPPQDSLGHLAIIPESRYSARRRMD